MTLGPAGTAGMQHEVIRDACVTIGHVLESHLPTYVDQKTVSTVFDIPDEKELARAKSENALLVSVLWIDTTKSMHQSTNQPIIHQEDEEGNLVEYRCGASTYLTPRYLVTPWAPSLLDAQVATGAILQYFYTYPDLKEEQIQGESLAFEDKPSISLDDSVQLADQLKLWEVMGNRPYRPSLVVRMNVKLGSIKRQAIRRVREKINVYRKVEA